MLASGITVDCYASGLVDVSLTFDGEGRRPVARPSRFGSIVTGRSRAEVGSAIGICDLRLIVEEVGHSIAGATS